MAQEAEQLAAFDRLVAPLLAAGWALRERYVETGYGDDVSVIGQLERAGELIDVERFPDEAVQVFSGGGSGEDDPEPPLFQAKADAEAIAEFANRGWL